MRTARNVAFVCFCLAAVFALRARLAGSQDCTAEYDPIVEWWVIDCPTAYGCLEALDYCLNTLCYYGASFYCQDPEDPPTRATCRCFDPPR